MSFFRTVALCCALTTGFASQTEAAPRTPTGKWVVDFADAQCLASRNYGTSEKPLLLALKAPAVGNAIQVAVVESGRGGDAMQTDAEFAVDRQKALKTTMLSFTPKGRKQTVHLINLPTAVWAGVINARSLSVRSSGFVTEEFALRQMPQIQKLLDQCVADLRTVWNVTTDSSSGPTLITSVQGNLQGLIKSNDYPQVAVDRSQGGSSVFVLLVDETGKVADCTITDTSGVASLDAQSCSIVKERAKFKPAIGLDGKPTKGAFTQRITWRVE